MNEGKPHKGKIKQWFMNPSSDRPTVAGFVYGHPVFPDGTFITTSYIVDIKCDQAETRNSFYTLEGDEQRVPTR